MFSGGIDGLVGQVQGGAGAQALERKVWEVIVSLGARLLANVFGRLALRTTNEDLRARELKSEEVVLGTDKDYWQTVNTGFGKITFPLYSYRDYSRRPVVVTRTPAPAGPFSHHHRCKSSLLLVEWESPWERVSVSPRRGCACIQCKASTHRHCRHPPRRASDRAVTSSRGDEAADANSSVMVP